MSVGWASTDTSITAYTVKTYTAAATGGTGVASPDTPNKALTVTGLTNNTQYWFTVTPKNANGAGTEPAVRLLHTDRSDPPGDHHLGEMEATRLPHRRHHLRRAGHPGADPRGVGDRTGSSSPAPSPRARWPARTTSTSVTATTPSPPTRTGSG